MTRIKEVILPLGTKIFLGKDSKTNDELMKKFLGKENWILHTVAPGSPFCVLENSNPTKDEIKQAAIICASKSQDWRDNKKSVKLHLFQAKDSYKPRGLKQGTWSIKNKPRVIKAKRREIIKCLQENYKSEKKE